MPRREVIEAAGERVRGSGGRVTAARVRVLGRLLEAGRALSHHEIGAGLRDVDRVTLYRILDWLVRNGLAHRIAGPDRAWRYSIALQGHDEHAHFHCGRCGRLLCLGDVSVGQPSLPRGYRSERVEVTVTGCCADCR
ncbi:MAG TPA: transcriptional repressor [Burkholderiales bacterium]|nr:transcriptional repressor [Burkholderiales bacterium]